MHLSELKSKPVTELVEMANANEIEGANRLRKQELMFAILKNRAKTGEQRSSATARSKCCPTASASCARPTPATSPAPTTSTSRPSQIRRFNLHTGDTIEGEVRTPKDGERYFALVKVDKVNGEPPEDAKHKITVREPDAAASRTSRCSSSATSRPRRTSPAASSTSIAPIGKGQRGLLVSSPKIGQDGDAAAHRARDHRQPSRTSCLIVLLIDERPEEVTEMQRTVRGEVIASTFDEPATRHVQVAEMVIEKAKRLVEHEEGRRDPARLDHAPRARLQHRACRRRARC